MRYSALIISRRRINASSARDWSPNTKFKSSRDARRVTDDKKYGSGFWVLGSGSAVPGSPPLQDESAPASSEPGTRTKNAEPGTQNLDPEPVRFWRTLDELAGDLAFRERLYNEFPSEVEAIADETSR